MWDNDKYHVWWHILQHYNEDLDRSLKLLPNLTNQHVYFNCHSKVAAKFVVPFLNDTTAKILHTSGTTETSETTKNCQMLDQFFDYVKRNLEKHQKKIKPFLKPYINENDERFSWMTNQFLP